MQWSSKHFPTIVVVRRYTHRKMSDCTMVLVCKFPGLWCKVTCGTALFFAVLLFCFWIATTINHDYWIISNFCTILCTLFQEQKNFCISWSAAVYCIYLFHCYMQESFWHLQSLKKYVMSFLCTVNDDNLRQTCTNLCVFSKYSGTCVSGHLS